MKKHSRHAVAAVSLRSSIRVQTGSTTDWPVGCTDTFWLT